MSLLDRQLDQFKAAKTAEEKLKLTMGLLEDVTRSHRDPSSADYNECESSPCFFCELVAILKGEGQVPKPRKV
jgi:hypothetical protein